MPLVRVPATTANLGPGFDTVGLALNLYDEIFIEEYPELLIEIAGEGKGTIPRGTDNIVYRAACTVFERAGKKGINFRIKMNNRIPVARGLGSSAAALVGGFIGANAILGNPFSDEEIINMATALEGHADNVAPAVLGGMVISVRDVFKVYCRKIEPPRTLTTVVAVPDFILSTRVSRNVLPETVSLADAVYNVSRASMMLTAVLVNDLELMGKMMDDKLHQPYRMHLVPGMADVFKAAKEAGALSVALSGSGPSVIAFCDGCKPEVGPAMLSAFNYSGVKATLLELSPCSEGAIIINNNS